MRKIFALAALALLFSCKKNDEIKKEYMIEGRVIDYYENTGISNAIIYVTDQKVDPSDPQYKGLDAYDTTEFVYKIETDVNGNFSKKLMMGEEDSYRLIVYSKKIISVNNILVPKELENIELKVKQFKELVISLRNTQKVADSLSLISVSNILSSSKYIHLDAVDTTIFYNEAIPESNCLIKYILHVNGSSQQSNDTLVQISRLGLDSIIINY